VKKLISCVVFISFLFTLCSCTFSEKKSQETESAAIPKDNLYSDAVALNFRSLKDYHEFFSSKDSASNIVYYSDIEQFGDFLAFAGPDLAELYTKDSLDAYSYFLTDASGFVFTVRVMHFSDEFQNALDAAYKKVDVTIKGDLRTNPDMQKEIIKSDGPKKYSDIQKKMIELDGFRYYYQDGELYKVTWYENGIQFSLMGSGNLGEYPKGADTFVEKMLNAATAPDAIKTIKAMKITEGLPKGTADANITPVS